MKKKLSFILCVFLGGMIATSFARKSTQGLPLTMKVLKARQMKTIYMPMRLKMLHNRPDEYTALYTQEKGLKTHQWRARFNEGPVCAFFAAKACVGVVQLQYSANPRLNHVAELFGLYVEPEYVEDKKTVDEFMQYAIQEARLRKTERLYLKSMHSNIWLQDVARRNGFTLAWTEPKAIKIGDDGREDMVVYQLELSKK